MRTPRNWNVSLWHEMAVFFLALAAIPVACMMGFSYGRKSGLKEAAYNRLPKGSWSQSCDGLEVIVGEEWTTSFVPFSIGMGETYRIEMIAIKEGYDDLQPSEIACYLYPHKRCTWLQERFGTDE